MVNQSQSVMHQTANQSGGAASGERMLLVILCTMHIYVVSYRETLVVGRFVNTAPPGAVAEASNAAAQVHIVVGELPVKNSQRFSRSLGGGAVALRGDDDIVFLQSRLEEKLVVLKTMYENKGWGVRGHTVLSTASQLSTLNPDVSGEVSRSMHGSPGRSLFSRNSHQRAMGKISSKSPSPHKHSSFYGEPRSTIGPRQLYPMEQVSGRFPVRYTVCICAVSYRVALVVARCALGVDGDHQPWLVFVATWERRYLSPAK